MKTNDGLQSRIGRTAAVCVSGAALMAVVVGGAGVSTAAAAEPSPGQAPLSVETTATPPTGSMMPDFAAKPAQVGSPCRYSVAVTGIPATVQSGQSFTINARTTGFDAGNWVNVWVKRADGTQLDAGGMVTTGSQISVPARLITPGVTEIQLSVGSWPNEQWSQPIAVTVTNPPTSATEAEVFRTADGNPVILAAYNFSFGGGTRSAQFNLTTSNGTVTQSIQPQQGRWVTYSTTTPAPGDTAQSGSAVAMTITAMKCAPVFQCTESTW